MGDHRTGKRVGYIRTSTVEQNPARQLDQIQLDNLFIDHASGRSSSRPQLDALLAFVREGDTVLVHSMDRLARNLTHLRHLVQSLTQAGIHVQFLRENLTFTEKDSPIADLMLSLLGAFAEFERNLLRERQREGIALARLRGAYKGRKKALSPEQAAALCRRCLQGEPKASVARSFGISRETLYQYLRAPKNHNTLA